MIVIDYSDRRPLYEQITDRFIQLIVKGILPPEEQLPSVRSLAMELSINPNTIQRAYQELEREGFIYSVKGKGSFVCSDQDYLEEQKRQTLEALKACILRAIELHMDPEELLAQTSLFIKEGTSDD